jgi:hypothetical protein
MVIGIPIPDEATRNEPQQWISRVAEQPCDLQVRIALTLEETEHLLHAAIPAALIWSGRSLTRRQAPTTVAHVPPIPNKLSAVEIARIFGMRNLPPNYPPRFNIARPIQCSPWGSTLNLETQERLSPAPRRTRCPLTIQIFRIRRLW